MAQNKMVDAKQFSILPFIGKHNVPSKSSYASKLKPSLVRRGAGQAGVRISSTISPISSDSSSRTKRTTNTSTPSARVPRLKVRGASGKARLSARLSPTRGGNFSLSPSFVSNVPTRRNSKDGYQRSGRPSMDFMGKSRQRSKILKDTSETVLESYDIQPSPSPSFPLVGKLQDMPFADIKKFIEDIASPLFQGPQSVSSSFLTAPELEVHLEDMSAKAMKRLEYVFKVAEERDGPLPYDTFRSVIHAVLGHRVAEKELKIMFMKIDTNCDETVSWSEYLSFILCELQKKDLMRSTKNDNPLPDEISSTIHSRHHNFITRIRFTPALLNRGSRNEKWDKSLGKYISLSLDGTVCFWSQKMECKRVHSLHQSRVSAPIYCTDLVAMANINYIAVSTSQSDIRFYELSGQHRFERVMTVSHHKHLVLCMDYWFDEANMDKARLFWGDAGGNVFILTFWKCIDGGPFGNVSSSKNISLGQLLADVQCGQKNRYHVHKLRRLHLDWVRAIRYVPELDAVVSSCGETTTAMACTALHDMKSKLFVVHKGVICFDYSNNQNLLVSGGIEQNVRGWNPYINTGPIFRLKGTNAVVHLMVNNERDLCISISLDKNVSIFSLKDQTLVQLIPPRSFPKMIGHKPITSAYFNNDTQVLVVGTTDLSVFLPDLEREVSLRSNTHESDLCGVLFNPLYDLIVSGSVGSSVCVWDARTGEKKLMFDKAHMATLYNKETVIDLTAMSFDYTKRRLVTGGRDGTVKIWNFHNGDCLQVMETQGQMEVTGLVSLKYKLLVAGLNRRVTAFVDVQGTEGTAKVWEKKHEEDIQAMAYHHPNVLVTASYDGDIIIWSTETNQPACRMNCQESSKPMMGGERHKKMDSQRTLIAKNFNKGRIVSERFPHVQRRTLHFIDEEADDEKTEVIDGPVFEWNEWSRKPPAELTGSVAEESSYVSIASEVKTRTRNSIEMEKAPPQKCSNCFGFVVDVNNEAYALSLNIKAEQLCCCVESEHSSPPRLSGKHTTLEVDTTKMNSSEERNLGHRGHTKASERFMDDPIWQLRNTTTKQRRSLDRSFSSITETPVDPVAIRGPQALITTTSIECLAVLSKRKVERKTAAVFSGGLDGWIRAWSLHYKGGLMGQFRGSSQPGAAVTCMAVDDKNHHLLAGDAKGYITIWYVGDYCTKTPYTSTLSQEAKDTFIRNREKTYQRFLSRQFFERFEAKEEAVFRESASRPPAASNPEKTVHSPVLLVRFRGHLKAITCIEFASCYSMVITGSEDHNIRVWSMAGRYIGQLGNNTWPRIQQTGSGWINEMSEFSLPADVKRVATPRTLRVFNGGLSKRWKLVRNGIMMLVGPWVRMNEEKESAKGRFSSPSKPAGRVASPHVKLPSLSKEDLSAPDIENTHETSRSKILGKSYRKVGGHKAFPVYSSLFGPGNAMQVWMKLKTSELENIKEGAERPPPEVLEMRNKRRSKYINQLIKARAARKLLAESVLAGTFKRFSGDDIPPERVLTISTGVDQNKPLTKLSPRFRNPFLPSRASDRRPRSKSKSSKHNQQPEMVTIDKLSLEICEIMGEANEN